MTLPITMSEVNENSSFITQSLPQLPLSNTDKLVYGLAIGIILTGIGALFVSLRAGFGLILAGSSILFHKVNQKLEQEKTVRKDLLKNELIPMQRLMIDLLKTVDSKGKHLDILGMSLHWQKEDSLVSNWKGNFNHTYQRYKDLLTDPRNDPQYWINATKENISKNPKMAFYFPQFANDNVLTVDDLKNTLSSLPTLQIPDDLKNEVQGLLTRRLEKIENSESLRVILRPKLEAIEAERIRLEGLNIIPTYPNLLN